MEIAIEDIVVIFITSILLAGVCYAGVMVRMPIKTNIVQCGSREDLSQSCMADARCCALLENAGNNADHDSSLFQKDNQNINYEHSQSTGTSQSYGRPSSRTYEYSNNGALDSDNAYDDVYDDVIVE